MTQEEMRQEFQSLYDMMALSDNVAYMHTFGSVHRKMMDWMIQNKPSEAEEFISQLEAIRWNNYLTPKEAEAIIAGMNPKAPWSREQWRNAMSEHELELEDEPHYNRCALYVVMSMIMSDSGETLSRYAEEPDLFELVYSLALDKLKDKDGRFNVRKYFSV